jgi:hypothetical protein
MSAAGLLLSLHYAAAPLSWTDRHDFKVLNALRAIGNELMIAMAAEELARVTAELEAKGWR